MGLVAAGRPGLLSISFGIGVVVLPILMPVLGRYDLVPCRLVVVPIQPDDVYYQRIFLLESVRAFRQEILLPVWTSLLAVMIMVVVLMFVKSELYRLEWRPVSVLVTVIPLSGFVYSITSVLLDRRLMMDCITFMKKML